MAAFISDGGAFFSSFAQQLALQPPIQCSHCLLEEVRQCFYRLFNF